MQKIISPLLLWYTFELDARWMLLTRWEQPSDIEITNFNRRWLLLSRLETTVKHLDIGIRILAEEERNRIPSLASLVPNTMNGRHELAIRLSFQVLLYDQPKSILTKISSA